MNLIYFKTISLNSLWKHIAVIHWQKSLRKYFTKALDRKKVYFYRFFFMSCKFMKTLIFFLNDIKWNPSRKGSHIECHSKNLNFMHMKLHEHFSSSNLQPQLSVIQKNLVNVITIMI